MIRPIGLLLLCLISRPLTAENLSNTIVVTNPSQIVSLFQQTPHNELICEDKTWGDFEPDKVGIKFEALFSKEFYKLFIWSQCGKPKSPPPHYFELNTPILWDIRFGFPFTGLLGEKSVIAENVRVLPAKTKGADKAIVKVLYDFGTLKNLVTTYTLIREDGLWKIDDIAPKGDFVEGDDQEPHLEHSDSIKTDMQNNYRAAEKRYQQELAKKSATPKP